MRNCGGPAGSVGGLCYVREDPEQSGVLQENGGAPTVVQDPSLRPSMAAAERSCRAILSDTRLSRKWCVSECRLVLICGVDLRRRHDWMEDSLLGAALQFAATIAAHCSWIFKVALQLQRRCHRSE